MVTSFEKGFMEFPIQTNFIVNVLNTKQTM